MYEDDWAEEEISWDVYTTGIPVKTHEILVRLGYLEPPNGEVCCALHQVPPPSICRLLNLVPSEMYLLHHPEWVVRTATAEEIIACCIAVEGGEIPSLSV